MLDQWRSLQGGAHSDKDMGRGDRFGTISAVMGLSTWAALIPRCDRNLGDKYWGTYSNWLDDVGREERHR